MHVIGWLECIVPVILQEGAEATKARLLRGELRPFSMASRRDGGPDVEELRDWVSCPKVEKWLLGACPQRGFRLEELEDGRLLWRASDWVWNHQKVADVQGQLVAMQRARERWSRWITLKHVDLLLGDLLATRDQGGRVSNEIRDVFEWLLGQAWVHAEERVQVEVAPAEVSDELLARSGLSLSGYCTRSHEDVLIRASVELGTFMAKDQPTGKVKALGVLGLLQHQYHTETGLQSKPRGPKKSVPAGGAGWQVIQA